MKRIKSDRWLYVPGSRIPIQFKFTADETKEFEEVLRTFDKDKVGGFLFSVSTMPYIPLFLTFKGRTFPKGDIEKNILPDLKQCEVTLERILQGFDPDPQRNFNSLRDDRIRKGESPWNICFENAEKALPYIRAIEKTLEGVLTENKRRRGRPETDEEGLVSEVAALYKKYFGKEPGRNKGTIFYKLIREIFKILDLKQDGRYHDVLNPIRRAIKSK